MNNALRSNRFEVAIMSLRDEYGDDIYTALIDLLADSMHWCDHNGGGFQFALAQACRHYINELNDDQQDERRLS